MAKLQVRLVFEVLGRPPENVTEALELIVNKISSDKGVHLIEKTVHPPVEIKDAKGLYTSFAEVLLELDSISNLFTMIFAFLPSHIEVINPESLELANTDLNDLANRLTVRLHQYDAIAKKMSVDKELLLRHVAKVAPEVFKKEVLPYLRGEVKENQKIKAKIEKSQKAQNKVKKEIKKKRKKR